MKRFYTESFIGSARCGSPVHADTTRIGPTCVFLSAPLVADSGEAGFRSRLGHTISLSRPRRLYRDLVENGLKLLLVILQAFDDLQTTVVERNSEGFRAIDAGPLTMGYRVSNERAGYDMYRRLVYCKGAYILHMIRMMMWDSKTGDQNFKELMRDFVRTYAGKAATTEDFKAMVEKHMTPALNAAGDGKMDWFFNEYVYGTALPTYSFSSSFEKDANGDVVLGFTLTQSGVDDKFLMVVPVYFELADGRAVHLGRIRVMGNNSMSGKVPLKGMKDVPKRALINYNDDVLALTK